MFGSTTSMRHRRHHGSQTARPTSNLHADACPTVCWRADRDLKLEWEPRCKCTPTMRVSELWRDNIKDKIWNTNQTRGQPSFCPCSALKWKPQAPNTEHKIFELLCAAAEQLRGSKRIPFNVECTVWEASQVRSASRQPHHVMSMLYAAFPFGDLLGRWEGGPCCRSRTAQERRSRF